MSRPDSDADSDPDQAAELLVQRFPKGLSPAIWGRHPNSAASGASAKARSTPLSPLRPVRQRNRRVREHDSRARLAERIAATRNAQPRVSLPPPASGLEERPAQAAAEWAHIRPREREFVHKFERGGRIPRPGPADVSAARTCAPHGPASRTRARSAAQARLP